ARAQDPPVDRRAHLDSGRRRAHAAVRDSPGARRAGAALIEMIPPDDRAVWSVWVGLVVGDLERAMRRPTDDWNQAWARGLLLVASSGPVPRGRRAPIWPVKLTSLAGVDPYHV